MTYLNKFSLFQVEEDPSAQTWSGSEVDYKTITGSTCYINAASSSPTIMYKFTFYARNINERIFLNIKLQKSNDNFSSNTVDMDGYKVPFAHDTQESSDLFRSTCPIFFIIENFDSKYLRLQARPYDASWNSIQLHRSADYDNNSAADVYYNPTLIVAEL